MRYKAMMTEKFWSVWDDAQEIFICDCGWKEDCDRIVAALNLLDTIKATLSKY